MPSKTSNERSGAEALEFIGFIQGPEGPCSLQKAKPPHRDKTAMNGVPVNPHLRIEMWGTQLCGDLAEVGHPNR